MSMTPTFRDVLGQAVAICPRARIRTQVSQTQGGTNPNRYSRFGGVWGAVDLLMRLSSEG